MVQAEFLLELLMRLLAHPSRLDCRGQCPEVRVGWEVGHVVFLLARRPALADKPDLLAWHALHANIEHAVFVALGDADALGREEARRPTLRAASPVDPYPFVFSQGRFGGERRLIWNAVFTWPSGIATGKIKATSAG